MVLLSYYNYLSKLFYLLTAMLGRELIRSRWGGLAKRYRRVDGVSYGR